MDSKCEDIFGDDVEDLDERQQKIALLEKQLALNIAMRRQLEKALRESNAQIEQIQEIAHLGSWQLDVSTGQMIWSDEVYRIFGLLPQELSVTYGVFLDLVHPEDRDLVNSVYSGSVREDKDGYEIEYRINRKYTGKIRYIYEKCEHVRDASGKIVRAVGLVQDISERKMTEQALRTSEEKYRTTLNASPDGILFIDIKGIITDISEIGLELFGAYTKDDLVGKHFFRFLPPEEKNTIREIIEKTMNEGITLNIEIKTRRKNHSTFLNETSTTLIQGSNGIPLSFMVIIRDISQRKKMEAMRIHADRMVNLGEMASGIAHEINQPLNIISLVMDKILYVSATHETIDIDFFKSKSDKIFENIIRIRNIIDHIRAFSRSNDDYILTAFDINLSIENAVMMISEQYKSLAINLNIQLEKQIPQISGNSYKFEQVIINLLANAKEAVVEKKGKQKEYFDMIVGIRSYQENQFIIVEVTDNGIGISSDDINNIILPFYTTKDEGKGTGLGLPICCQIVKEMGGTLEIASDIFNGTKIKISIFIKQT